MADIIKIVIKGSSGYCCAEEAFNDKVTITPESISYEYNPFIEKEINPKRKWSYKTNSPIFKKIFSNITGMLPGILDRGIKEFSILKGETGNIYQEVLTYDISGTVISKVDDETISHLS